MQFLTKKNEKNAKIFGELPIKSVQMSSFIYFYKL